jgi:hypothetical protein
VKEGQLFQVLIVNVHHDLFLPADDTLHLNLLRVGGGDEPARQAMSVFKSECPRNS